MVIILCRAVEYCLDMENMNLSAIRTIRVLRPLRAINRIPSKLYFMELGTARTLLFQLIDDSHSEDSIAFP